MAREVKAGVTVNLEAVISIGITVNTERQVNIEAMIKETRRMIISKKKIEEENDCRFFNPD